MRLIVAVWTVAKSYGWDLLNWIGGIWYPKEKTSARNLDFTSVRYSQLWEDGRTLRRGLSIQDGEVVLSIAAAGDNALGLLLDNPSKLVAVDISPAQIALLSLKIHAIKHLSYEEFTQLLGLRLDNIMMTSISTRRQIYNKLRPFLPVETRDFWDRKETAVDSGIINCGHLERLFELFRTCVTAIAHSKETIAEMLEKSSLKEQQSFYRDRWDTWLWRVVHQTIFSRVIIGRARDASLVESTSIRNISEYMMEKHNTYLNESSISDNFYEEYILTGNISGRNGLPDYLKRENYALLRQRVDRVQLLNVDLFLYLDEVAESDLRFDAFNLSDIFEWFPLDVCEKLFKSLISVSNPGARLAYWNFLNRRRRPESLADRLVPQSELSSELYKKDRLWMYSDFIVEKVK